MPIPIRERGYAHQELLAETDWLAGRLSDPTIRVVDARSDKDYARGHIPGAVHLDGWSLGGLRTGSEMPEPEAFAHLIGALGIDEHTKVVVYDAGRPPPTAGVVAWALLYYGHPDARLLDGGLTKWTGEGQPLSNDAPAHEPRAFAARLAEGVYCSLTRQRPPSMTTVSSSGTCAASASSRGRPRGGTLRPGSGTCRELSTWIGPSSSILRTGR